MQTVREIEQALYDLAPKDGMMNGDNVGHLVGDPEEEVKHALIALDITESVVDEAAAKGCDLIISHHPVINSNWTPVQSVRCDTLKGRILTKLIRNNISAICMHTNLDVAPGGVNDRLAERLGLENVEVMENGLIRTGCLSQPMALRDFAAFLKDALGCNGVRYSDAGKRVFKVAVGGGSCGDYEEEALCAGCDTFVTADLKYNQFLDARDINLVDAGHFPTEDPVCEVLIQYITAKFPELTAEKSASHREVIQYYV